MEGGDDSQRHGQVAEAIHRQAEVTETRDEARVTRGDAALVGGPQANREVLEHERQAEADEQRVLDLRLVIETRQTVEQPQVQEHTNQEERGTYQQERH